MGCRAAVKAAALFRYRFSANCGRSATVKRGSPFGRRGIDHAKAAGADFADLERALGDAAVVEAENAVDPAETVGGEQTARREIAHRLPVARDAHRQQPRIIPEAGEPVRRTAETGRIYGGELGVEPERNS